MSALDGSIVIIALPAIFRGIHLDPLAAGNIGYLLWMIMGYRLVQAVLVVTVGRLGDMFGRVRIYNAGFAVFTVASVLLSFDPVRRRPRRAVADRLAGAPGARRLDAHRQLGGHPDRCVSRRPARLRPGHQPGRRSGRPVHRAGGGRPAGRPGLARGVLGQRARRDLRDAVGLPQAPRHRARAAAAASTGGATSPSPSAWAPS